MLLAAGEGARGGGPDPGAEVRGDALLEKRGRRRREEVEMRERGERKKKTDALSPSVIIFFSLAVIPRLSLFLSFVTSRGASSENSITEA